MIRLSKWWNSLSRRFRSINCLFFTRNLPNESWMYTSFVWNFYNSSMLPYTRWVIVWWQNITQFFPGKAITFTSDISIFISKRKPVYLVKWCSYIKFETRQAYSWKCKDLFILNCLKVWTLITELLYLGYMCSLPPQTGTQCAAQPVTRYYFNIVTSSYNPFVLISL